MTLIWKPWYTAGDPVLDEQHRALFTLVNELGALIKAKRFDCPEVDGLLKEMGNQIDVHFVLEEGCMARHACPMAQKNKEEHGQFLEIYNGFMTQFGKKKSLAGLRRFHKSSSGWLEAHICFVDIHLRSCVRHGSGG